MQRGVTPRARGASRGTVTRGSALRGRGKNNTVSGEAQQSITNSPAPTEDLRPQRNNANIHPGQVVLDNTQKGRTSEQVKRDKAKADADVLAAAKSQENRTKETVRRLAAAEERIKQKDLEYIQHVARPDLQALALPPKKKSKYISSNVPFTQYINLKADIFLENSNGGALEGREMSDDNNAAWAVDERQANEADINMDGLDLPEPSTLDSGSDGFARESGEGDFNFDSAEEDLDYVMAEEEDEEDEVRVFRLHKININSQLRVGGGFT